MADLTRNPAMAGGPISMNSLGELRAFVAVVETGSFSAAAQALDISQPTVSQRLRSLETLFGLRLLERRNGVTLTDAGREIFNRARFLISQADELGGLARDLGELRHGRLAIGFSTPNVAMPYIARICEMNPGLAIQQVTGNTGELLELMEDFGIDAAIMTMKDAPANLRSFWLESQYLVAAVSRDHPLAGRDEITLREIAESDRVLLREKGSVTRQVFEICCEMANTDPENTMQVPSREAAKEAAAAGLGIGIVFDSEFGEDARLHQIKIIDAAARGEVYGVSLQNTVGLPVIEAFFDICRELSARDPDHIRLVD